MKLHRYLIAMGAATLLTGCDLNEEPQAQASDPMIFGSELGLKTYHYSFYNQIPDCESLIKADFVQCDYIMHASLGTKENGTYDEESATSWSWTTLRNINYFLENNVNTAVAEDIRNNYNGVARLFRARFYFERMKTYGEVPWIDKVFNSPEDPDLYNGRDSRDVIIGHIMEDLDFAYENIQQSSPTWNSSTVTKWVAMAYKSRVCLFEAAWRRYHAGTDYVKGCDKYTAEQLYQIAADAAKEVMDKGPYQLYTSGTYANGAGGAFRRLFTEENAVTTEVMLAQVFDEELQKRGQQNYFYNRPATYTRSSFSRKFMNSFLNKDGSPYSETDAAGNYKEFKEETTDRDPRLNMSIRAWDYKMKTTSGDLEFATAPMVGNMNLSGYHPTKYVADDASIDLGVYNTNDLPIMRYAEVLLNYAEAMAELGKMDNTVWTETIGALRKRAGITGGTTATGTLTTAPSGTPEPYIAAYYPGVSDAKILEVRRERACELALEGFRVDDLKRWRLGKLFVDDPWEGIFFPKLEIPLDLNGDGVDDVFFHNLCKLPTKYNKYKNIAKQLPGTTKDPHTYVARGNGYVLKWNLPGREWADRMYLLPIPNTVYLKNPNLGQNPGWSTPKGGATAE